MLKSAGSFPTDGGQLVRSLSFSAVAGMPVGITRIGASCWLFSLFWYAIQVREGQELVCSS
jgi:hypothetical protein